MTTLHLETQMPQANINVLTASGPVASLPNCSPGAPLYRTWGSMDDAPTVSLTDYCVPCLVLQQAGLAGAA